MPRSATLVLALVVCAGIALWFLARQEPGGSSAAPLATPGTTKAAPDALAANDAPESAVRRRDATSTTPAAEPSALNVQVTTGSLTVQVLWPDRSPAPGIALSFRRAERFLPRTIVQLRVTDDAGLVSAKDLPPGPLQVRSDRGGELAVTIVAGSDETHELVLPAGLAVVGVVRDRRARPVAGAEVWLQTERTDWAGGRVVATAGADGTFALRDVPAGLSLGALAAGFAPSRLVDLDGVDTAQTPVEIELIVEDGAGAVEGRVQDHAGRPIAGALVAVGAPPTHLDWRGPDRWTEQWTPRTATSDAEGRFALAGVSTGAHPVAARADGFGVWRGDVRVDTGASAWIDVTLGAAIVLHGTVTDEAGNPLAGAIVRAYDRAPRTPFVQGGQIDFDLTFDHRAARTDDAGRYRMTDVGPGDVHAFAQAAHPGRSGVSVPFARAVLRAEPGETLAWNPTITAGRTIDGVVLHRDGTPMPHVFVTAKDEQGGPDHVLVNDAEGRFRFVCLEGLTYALSVQYWSPPKGTPPLRRTGVIPGPGLVELRAPFDAPVVAAPGEVEGRIADIHERIPHARALGLALISDQHSWRENATLGEHGSFHFDDVEPGRYRIVALVDGFAVAQRDWFEVAPGETKDVGVLETSAAGTLVVHVERDAATRALEPKLFFTLEGWSRGGSVELGRLDVLRVEALTAGRYVVTGHARGMVGVRAEVTVEADREATLRLRLQAAVAQRFEIHLPEGATDGSLTMRILDARGETFWEGTRPLAELGSRPEVSSAMVPRGEWTLEVGTDGGLHGSTRFRIDSVELEPPAVRVDVRPR